jgi:hypothetical protein
VKTGKDAKLTSIQEKIKNAVEKGGRVTWETLHFGEGEEVIATSETPRFIYCMRCGTQIETEATYCHSCEAQLEEK